MPQLDKVTLFSQLFWMALLFMGFYVIIRIKILPMLAMSQKIRKRWFYKMGKTQQYLKAKGDMPSMMTLALQRKLITNMQRGLRQHHTNQQIQLNQITKTYKNALFAMPQEKQINANVLATEAYQKELVQQGVDILAGVSHKLH